jgi:NAD(P)-dependent dehydrogenase (short-subunit alcohol dehydrogenase family)
MPTVLIIGASRGLGRAMTEDYLDRGWDVIATVLEHDGLADLTHDRLTVERVDTTDWPGVDALRQKLGDRPLDLLMMNAGIKGPSEVPIGDADPDAFVQLMLVNVLAPLRLVERFADLVKPQGTVAVMSSGMGSISRNTYATWEAYRTSKAALNMGMKSIAARRADTRTYILANPGWTRTAMGGDDAPLSIEEVIPNLIDVLDRRAGSGGLHYVDYKDEDIPW